METLFSFGPLLDPVLQEEVFGEALGYVPATTRYGEGGLVTLEDSQLQLADGRFGVRRRVALADGTLAWAYLDPQPFARTKKLAVLGDSIAYGRDDADGGWAARLGRQVARFWNLAIPGETMARIATYGADEALRRDVDTVIVAAGGNDIATGASPETVLADLVSIVEPLEERGVRVVVLGPTWMDAERATREFGVPVRTEGLEALRALLTEWGAETFHDVIDLWEPLKGRTALLADGVHPTHEGHAVLFSELVR